MNPRRRRMLIPGLLIALLVVVIVAALKDRAEAATHEPVARLADERIVESSGLAISRTFDDLAYTVNDSGHAAEIYAIDLRSGQVVGVTTVRAKFRDVEALALRDGTLWVADVGDNVAQRDDAALYALDEPGRTTAGVEARRYGVTLDGGPVDVEALLADPGSDELFVVTKTWTEATVLSVAEGELDPATTNRLVPVATGLPALVTDGAFSPDGSRAALLSYGAVWTVDPVDWSVVGSRPIPQLAQAETLAFVGSDEVLIGSEGVDSPLYRIVTKPVGEAPVNVATVATSRPAPESETATTPARAADSAGTPWAVAAAVAALGSCVLVALAARRVRAARFR